MIDPNDLRTMALELESFSAELSGTPFHQVHAFHKRFAFPLPAIPVVPPSHIAMERIRFMEEELQELALAAHDGDLVGYMDAVLDLVYVAIGTGLQAGISPRQLAEGFEAVHAANMAKVPVASAAESKRGMVFDAKKPSGWVPPEHALATILATPNKVVYKSQ